MSEISGMTMIEINHCIKQCMLDPDDFSVDMVEQQQDYSVVEIKYKPNGTAKRYRHGSGCEFPIDFCFDVSSGVFGAIA